MKKAVIAILFAALLLSFSAVNASAAGLNVTLDFSSDEFVTDTLVKEYSPFSDFFYVEQVGDEPNFRQASYADFKGKKVMSLNGYFSAYTYDAFKSVYFEAEVNPGGNANGSVIFFRASQPVTRNNPKNAGDSTFTFYEWDWYAENGGKNNPNGSNIGNSGCGIMLGVDGSLTLLFKTYETDGLRVGNYPVTFKNVGTENGYYKVAVKDVDSKATVYINGNAVASVEMSAPKVYTDDTADQAEYYSHAKVYGADGAVLAEIDNTRLATANRLAIASRNKQWYVSSVVLKTEDYVDAVESPVTTDAATEAPETNPEKPVTTGAGSTAAPKDTADSADTAAGKTDNTGRENVFLIITIVCSFITVLSVIFTAFMLSKRRHS